MRRWAQIYRELRAARVKTVTPEATVAAMDSRRAPGPLDALLGAPPVLLDVREEVYHRKARPEGSVNAPLYKQLVRSYSAVKHSSVMAFISPSLRCSACHCTQMEPKNAYEWARVVSFGLLALRPPVRNEEFIQDVLRLVGGKKARTRPRHALSARNAAQLVLTRSYTKTIVAQNTPIYVICSSGGTLESASERKVRRRTMHACARA